MPHDDLVPPPRRRKGAPRPVQPSLSARKWMAKAAAERRRHQGKKGGHCHGAARVPGLALHGFACL